MPTVLTWNEACHSAVAPGLRLTAKVLPAWTRLASLPWLRYPSIASRVWNQSAEVNSWTSSPVWVWPVPLLTVPVTVTVLPGRAVCGLIESMTIDSLLDWAAGCAGLACAGAARASAAVAAAGTTAAAVSSRIRRVMLAGRKPYPRTPEMLWPFGTEPALYRLPSMAVPMSDEQREAAATLLRERVPEVRDLGRMFARAGYELALVGGSVRDVFRGEWPAGDFDLTTDATPEQVLAVVDGWADATWTAGIAFGTVGLRKGSAVFEITTYRTEQYRATSRRPDVQYGRSLEEDLSRRDFTINAMAARLPGYELVDPFGGLEALKDKVLRTPGRAEDSFGDDPLRILRAARFAAKLGFTVADEVRAAMTDQADRLGIVSAERVTGELTKLMLTPDPAVGIDLLVQTGVADQVLPEVSRLRMEADEHHRHKDVYQHSLTVLRRAIELEPFYGLAGDLTVRLAALLHDIGKPKTRSLLPDGRVAFHHHEVVGAKMTRRRLTELRFPNDVVRDVSRLVELHLRFHGYGEGATGSDRGTPGGSSPAEPAWTDSAVRRYVRDAGPLLTRLHVLTRADCTTRNQAKAQRLARAYDGLEQRIAELGEQEELSRLRPELNGNDIMRILGLDPGPLVGEAYTFLLELRITRGPIGREQAIQELLGWAALEGIPVPEAPEPESGPDADTPDSESGPDSESAPDAVAPDSESAPDEDAPDED